MYCLKVTLEINTFHNVRKGIISYRLFRVSVGGGGGVNKKNYIDFLFQFTVNDQRFE